MRKFSFFRDTSLLTLVSLLSLHLFSSCSTISLSDAGSLAFYWHVFLALVPFAKFHKLLETWRGSARVPEPFSSVFPSAPLNDKGGDNSPAGWWSVCKMKSRVFTPISLLLQRALKLIAAQRMSTGRMCWRTPANTQCCRQLNSTLCNMQHTCVRYPARNCTMSTGEWRFRLKNISFVLLLPAPLTRPPQHSTCTTTRRWKKYRNCTASSARSMARSSRRRAMYSIRVRGKR